MLVALPFAYRVLEGRLSSMATSHDRLCASLGIRGWRRFRQVTLPALFPELGYAAGLSSALSLGDLTIIALFGSQQFQTLPWLLYQTMGRYRAAEAAALAFWILGLTLAMFAICVLAARLPGDDIMLEIRNVTFRRPNGLSFSFDLSVEQGDIRQFRDRPGLARPPFST